MIKYNTHRIIITIIIVLIKNYVNSYLTTCMAQSIKLVSCNNNNKDTTIYLLVSLSSFNLRHLLLCLLQFTRAFFVFFSCFFFFLVAITPLYYIVYYRYYIYFHAHFFALNFTRDRKNWKFQISINIDHFFSPIIVIFNIIIIYKQTISPLFHNHL